MPVTTTSDVSSISAFLVHVLFPLHTCYMFHSYPAVLGYLFCLFFVFFLFAFRFGPFCFHVKPRGSFACRVQSAGESVGGSSCPLRGFRWPAFRSRTSLECPALCSRRPCVLCRPLLSLVNPSPDPWRAVPDVPASGRDCSGSFAVCFASSAAWNCSWEAGSEARGRRRCRGGQRGGGTRSLTTSPRSPGPALGGSETLLRSSPARSGGAGRLSRPELGGRRGQAGSGRRRPPAWPGSAKPRELRRR